MRILFITPLFHPEPSHLKGIPFVLELMKRGHRVEVLTGFPNYPGGEIYPGYRQRLWLREIIDGVPIIRVPLFPDHSTSGLRRMVSYLSLTFSLCIPGLMLIKRPDVVLVSHGAATLALPAMLLRLFRKIPYILDIQDIWPESVTSSGMLPWPILEVFLTKWCNWSQHLAARIIVLSEGYRQAVLSRGVAPEKISVIYNWSDERQADELKDTFLTSAPVVLPEGFTVVYAGNLGRVQALDAVLDAASSLQEESLTLSIVFVGDGIEAARLQQLAADKKLRNVHFLPRLPVGQVNQLLKHADALLLHLKDDILCRMGIPQKTQAYLATGKPVVAAVKGCAADLIVEAEAGIVCEPENPQSITKAIKTLWAMSQEERERLGRNGFAFYTKNLSFTVGVGKLEKLANSLVEPR